MTNDTMENGAIKAAVIHGGKVKNLDTVALVSLAISLKRIADQIAGVPWDHTPGADNTGHRLGVVDGIMHAIEQGLLAASQRG